MASRQLRSFGLLRPKRLPGPKNIRLVTDKAKTVEEHARTTSYNWKMISAFVAAPGVAYLVYDNFFAGKHEEAFPSDIAYPHLKIRNKPFPWGDGDKSLFHSPHHDRKTEGEEENIPIEERMPLISKMLLWLMPDASEQKAIRDQLIRDGFCKTLQYIETRKRGIAPMPWRSDTPVAPSQKDVSVDGY